MKKGLIAILFLLVACAPSAMWTYTGDGSGWKLYADEVYNVHSDTGGRIVTIDGYRLIGTRVSFDYFITKKSAADFNLIQMWFDTAATPKVLTVYSDDFAGNTGVGPGYEAGVSLNGKDQSYKHWVLANNYWNHAEIGFSPAGSGQVNATVVINGINLASDTYSVSGAPTQFEFSQGFKGAAGFIIRDFKVSNGG